MIKRKKERKKERKKSNGNQTEERKKERSSCVSPETNIRYLIVVNEEEREIERDGGEDGAMPVTSSR